MKKKIIFMLTAVLLFSVLTGGCAVPNGPAEEKNDIQSSPCLAERLVGRYRSDREENGETVLEFYWIDGTLIAEAEQEYAAYFAAELIPEEPAVLYSTAADSAAFTAYAFSGFSNFGGYWEETPQITIMLTDSGFSLVESNGIAVEFQRDDTLDPIHVADRYAEHLPPKSGTAYPKAMLGTWTAEYFGGYRIMLRLNDDGTFLWYCKKENEPVVVHIGIGTVIDEAERENRFLSMITERVGYAAMPWQYSIEYELTKTGILLLKNSDADGLLPTEDEAALTQDYEKE